MKKKPTAQAKKTTEAKTDDRRRFRADGTNEVLALDPKAFDWLFESNEPDEPMVTDGIAVVSISGPLEHHSGGWFWDSYDSIIERISASLAAEETKAVLLCIDSPGGEAAGMVETHRKIRSLRAQHGKPIYAFANECAASAAYGLASAADQVWLPETAHVGSIGVIASVYDRTAANEKEGINARLITTGARKGDGHPDKPLTDDVVSALQDQVDKIGAAFFGIVADSRGKSVEDVMALEAGVFIGRDAVTNGLADGVCSYDELIAQIQESISDDSSGPIEPTPTETSMTKLQLIKARKNAEAALLAAKTDDEKKKAMSALSSAVRAEEKYDEEEDDDEKKKPEADDAEEDEDGDDDKDKKDDAEEDEDEEDDSDDAEEDEEEKDDSTGAEEEDDEDDKKAFGSKTGLYTSSRLLRLCRQVTGAKRLSEVFGALSAMQTKLAGAAKLKARVERLEAENKTTKVKAMIGKATKEGRITPAEGEHLRAQGMKDPKWLAGYLGALDKKRVRTIDDGAIEGSAEGSSSPLAKLNQDQRRMCEMTASATGRKVEEVAAELLSNVNKKNVAPARTH